VGTPRHTSSLAKGRRHHGVHDLGQVRPALVCRSPLRRLRLRPAGHGWPLSGRAWQDNIPALVEAGYRAIAYDRRGFGDSEKPSKGYDYDQLADDLEALMNELELTDVTLVGFSMGGGEVARYIAKHSEERLRSVVFALAVPPYLMKTDDNPDGPLDESAAEEMASSLENDRDGFFDTFTRDFFSADGELKVTEQQRQDAIALCQQSDQNAALSCMESFGGTDFRDDLTKVTVPTLVIHGDSDATVPFEGSGKRTHGDRRQRARRPGRRPPRDQRQPSRRVQPSADRVPRSLTGTGAATPGGRRS